MTLFLFIHAIFVIKFRVFELKVYVFIACSLHRLLKVTQRYSVYRMFYFISRMRLKIVLFAVRNV